MNLRKTVIVLVAADRVFIEWKTNKKIYLYFETNKNNENENRFTITINTNLPH